MFGNVFGDMQEKQEALKERLKTITVDEEAGEGKIRVTANGVREILNISIAPDLASDTDQLEDLLLVAINRVMERAAAVEAAETKKLLTDMLPPGLGNLGNLFGK